jgi:hypothetical protein
VLLGDRTDAADLARRAIQGRGRIIRRSIRGFFLQKHDFPDYLRLLVDYGQIDAANDAMVVYIDGVLGTLTSSDARTWLPYSTIDDLLVLNAKAKAKPQVGRSFCVDLDLCLAGS